MTGHVIDFKDDGTVEAMHNDKFDLSFLGRQSIQRATEIRFEEDPQTWSICLPTRYEGLSLPRVWVRLCDDAGGFASYETAREVEVEWLNTCRLSSTEPSSEDGLRILREVRDWLGK